MISGGDPREAARQPVDEILGLVLIAGGELGDLALGVLVLQRVEADQRHRMDLDVVADDEFHAGEADAVGRDAPPAEGGGRVGEVEHHLRARFRNAGEIELLGFEIGGALVDEAWSPSAQETVTSCSLCRTSRRIAGADDRRQPELAADDGGVRGAPAVIGDDGGRALHDRHPVRIGRAGDENRAVDEAVDVARASRSGRRGRSRPLRRC